MKKIQKLIPPELQSWEDTERAHIAALRGKDKKERSQYFKDHSDWNKWIPILSELTGGKCWYTESPANSNHWAIEHFRPKNRAIIQIATSGKNPCLEDGYWWLAYNVENFRLAGSIVNLRRKDEFSEEDIVLGKGNYFPLHENCQACQPEQNHNAEICLLLDPANFRDTTFISFDADGSVIPTKQEGSVEFLKFKISEEFLGLNHSQLKTERKKIWDACSNLIKKAEKLHGYAQSPQNENQKDETYEQLKALALESAPFSSTAKACIKFHFKTYPERFQWLEEVLESI